MPSPDAAPPPSEIAQPKVVATKHRARKKRAAKS
jgi:hypothetical protein